MRMVECGSAPSYFEANPALRSRIEEILAQWEFAEGCCVDIFRLPGQDEIDCYFRCPKTEAGAFLRISCLNRPEFVDWLRRALEDTLATAQPRA